MSITEFVDERILDLEDKRKQYIVDDMFVFANQMWARIQELKALKIKYSDKHGDWLPLYL
ncbi:hypothetical protein [Paenibacillus ferrarius]|nr:hypothetical protein [Paenibacillus ferrarius]